MPTYVVKHTRETAQGTQYVTLTLTGTETACVMYLRSHVEDDGLVLGDGTMAEYLQAVRDYMEENGGCAIWDVHCDGVELECYVNGYMWDDEWERAEANGHSYISNTVTL